MRPVHTGKRGEGVDCNVIQTGSHGNCVILNRKIAIDMGVTFKMIEPYVKDIQLVLLTHVHS